MLDRPALQGWLINTTTGSGHLTAKEKIEAASAESALPVVNTLQTQNKRGNYSDRDYVRN